MSNERVRVGVGARFLYRGAVMEVVDLKASAAGSEVVLRTIGDQLSMTSVSVRELLFSGDARGLHDDDDPRAEGSEEHATVVLAQLTPEHRQVVSGRAADVREVLTGYRSGCSELAGVDEPQERYRPELPLTVRYEAKAVELSVSLRTIKQWVADYRRHGEAGLVRTRSGDTTKSLGRTDQRWVEMALQVMVEHTNESRPSRAMVIARTRARVIARYGEGSVSLPSSATAYRVLQELERRHPTFRLSTKRNRDVADRPHDAYGKLRPTRPGEYLLMDTTRLDVFALDPLTLRWMQAELTVGMDWYTRCITGIRVTPVSTKAADAAATLYQAYRPPPAGREWPARAVWPEHGVPRSVVVDPDAIEGPLKGASGPAIVPETIVVDHGKIYLSEHLTSVCQRMSISIQPVRLRTGRDKGPVERFFRTLREGLLQALPGYKGPDVHSRGLDPESEAFFYLDELEDIIREWVAVVYHHRPHDSLVDPHVPGLRMSPAAMFEHGVARAGYIEAPANPDLAYEFLRTEWRTVQHYGVEYGSRRYGGSVLEPYKNKTSSYRGVARGRWPFQIDPDDITRIYFYDQEYTKRWHALEWEHAKSMDMPLSEDALRFARRLAATKYTYPDDKIAVADLFDRWNVGLGTSTTERRIAIRLAREASAIADDTPATDSHNVETLPSVARVLDPATNDTAPGVGRRFPRGGDEHDRSRDVSGGDVHAGADSEAGNDDQFDEADFYADALEDV